MKKIFVLASALLLASGAASVQAGAAYGSFDAGFSAMRAANIDLSTGDAGSFSTDEDIALAGALGWYVDSSVRLEAELGYFQGGLTSGRLGGTSLSLSGSKVSTVDLMGNILFDWRGRSSFTPYLGFGAGVAQISADVAQGAALRIDDADTVFAWQVIAGVSYQMSPQWIADLNWRYFDTEEGAFDSTVSGAAATAKMDVSSNILRLGLRYNLY